MSQRIPMSAILKELKIKNFKCFEKEQIIKFKKITFLTGGNSSGKSSIINAILASIQSGEFPYKFSPNGKYINMGDFEQITNKHSKTEITIGLTLHIPTTKRDYVLKTSWINNIDNNLPELNNLNFSSEDFSLNLKKGDKNFVLDFSYDPEKDRDYSKEKDKERKDKVWLELVSEISRATESEKPDVIEKKLKQQRKYFETWNKPVVIKNVRIKNIENIYNEITRKNNVHLTFVVQSLLENIFVDYNDSVNLISSFRHHPERTYLEQSKDKLKIDKFGDGYLDQIILWEQKKNIKFKQLKEIMKELTLIHSLNTHRFEGGRYEIQVTTSQNGTNSSLFDVGFGISQFLPVIVADLQLGDNSTLMVAEPEIHLHPDVQAKFGDYLVNQINNKKTIKNYIIETHSEYLLNRIRLAIVNGDLKESDLAVYYLENNGDDVTIHNLKFNKKGNIENAPKSFFDTYLMDIKEIALNV